MSLLSLALGFLSYIVVEKPFRNRARISLRVTSAAVGSGYLGLLAVSLVVVHYEGFPQRIPEGVEWRSLGEKIDVQGDVCKTVEDREFKGVETASLAMSLQVVRLPCTVTRMLRPSSINWILVYESAALKASG